MNNINPVGFAVLVVIGSFCVYIAVRYFWPLLIVIAAVFLTGWLKTRHTAKEAEKTAARRMQQDTQEQMKQKRPDSPQVIDAEFTLKEEVKEND